MGLSGRKLSAVQAGFYPGPGPVQVMRTTAVEPGMLLAVNLEGAHSTSTLYQRSLMVFYGTTGRRLADDGIRNPSWSVQRHYLGSQVWILRVRFFVGPFEESCRRLWRTTVNKTAKALTDLAPPAIGADHNVSNHPANCSRLPYHLTVGRCGMVLAPKFSEPFRATPSPHPMPLSTPTGRVAYPCPN
jgi:hypothetical protein